MMTGEEKFDAKHSKIEKQLVKRDGTSNWWRSKSSLLLLLGVESSLLGRKSSLLRLIELYRDGSGWDEGAFWARLGCNIYRAGLFWTTLRLWTELSLRAGLGLRTGLGTTSLGGTRSTLAFSTELILLKRRFSSCWGFAILSRRCHTSAGLFVKNKSGWATYPSAPLVKDTGLVKEDILV